MIIDRDKIRERAAYIDCDSHVRVGQKGYLGSHA
jgi:hypothetical protein